MEYPQAYSEKQQKARKEHKCCECRGYIQPGETYQKIWGIWDGDVGNFKTCQDCQAIRESEYHHRAYDERPALGMLEEHVEESHGYLSQAHQELLAVKLKRGASINRKFWDYLRAKAVHTP